MPTAPKNSEAGSNQVGQPVSETPLPSVPASLPDPPSQTWLCFFDEAGSEGKLCFPKKELAASLVLAIEPRNATPSQSWVSGPG